MSPLRWDGIGAGPVTLGRRKAHSDPVTTETRAAVMVRDRRCFVTRVDPDHVCRDQWGYPHPSDDLGRLTLDHVHEHAGGTKGKRAPSDLRHLVLMCHGANVGVPSRAIRQAERAYLRELYP